VVVKETSYQTECWFTYNRMDAWYGLKARTVQSGVKELRDAGLLLTRDETVDAPLSATGKTTQVYYSLTGEFSYASRAAMQKAARDEMNARAKKKRAKPKNTMKPPSPQTEKN
jgi:hypothetical protein